MTQHNAVSDNWLRSPVLVLLALLGLLPQLLLVGVELLGLALRPQ